MTETIVSPVTAPVVTPTKQQALKTAKANKPRPNLHVKTKGKRATPTPPKRGKLIVTLSPSELKAEIRELLDDLKSSKDPDEKKRIRRSLRVRGHRGGLGIVKA